MDPSKARQSTDEFAKGTLPLSKRKYKVRVVTSSIRPQGDGRRRENEISR